VKTRVCVSSGMPDARRRRRQPLRTGSTLTGAALIALFGERTHSDDNQLGEIPATAQKRAECIKDVRTSISENRRDDVAARHIENFDALSRSAPRRPSSAGKSESTSVLEMCGISSGSRATKRYSKA